MTRSHITRPHITPLHVAAAALALGPLLAGCSSAGADREAAPVTTTAVDVDDNTFGPGAIRVPVGALVTWTWVGDGDHNVVAAGEVAIDSGLQSEGTFSHTFDAPGRVDYRCTLHGGMTGVVLVGDVAGPSEGSS